MKIGHQLKKARESKRLSQHEVGELLGISQKTLSNIESNNKDCLGI
ncbi:helix-turn-helix domain-containing protein [Algoriphagus aquimarinus]|uniref:Helix-turn-helix transcriptional regulator n=1 Tax=Algoriphagus aquimarinus TaxID=237018 RepID=A0A5C7AEQ4_9BACT|nr:helix-turn-helix transcriptional regulator [Algoriphagus aquimarinus]